MTFKKDFLVNELDLPYNAIESEIVEANRWSLIYEIIFEYEGKFYATSYSQGATELQCEYPWEFEEDVECWEVEFKEVTVKKWVPKENC